MLGIPNEYFNIRRPGSIIHWYKSRLATRNKALGGFARVLPVVAQIEPTVRCDLACTFCHSKELRRTRKSPDMTLDQFKHVIDELHFLVGLGLVGMGEPTLHQDFSEMVRYAVNKGICTQTVTNCNRHTPEMSKQLVSIGLCQVHVSLDGATPESHERGRIGSSFERTVENLKQLVKNRGSQKYPKIVVQMLAFDYNYKEMPDFVRLCARIGVDQADIQARLTDWGKDAYVQKTLDKGGSLAGDDFERFLRITEQAASAEGIESDVIRNLYDDENKCRKPWREVYISTTGDVVPCCAIADPRVMSMGNIFRESFESIWNNDKYVSFRKAILSNNIPRCCFQCYSPETLRKSSRIEKGWSERT